MRGNSSYQYLIFTFLLFLCHNLHAKNNIDIDTRHVDDSEEYWANMQNPSREYAEWAVCLAERQRNGKLSFELIQKHLYRENPDSKTEYSIIAFLAANGYAAALDYLLECRIEDWREHCPRDCDSPLVLAVEAAHVECVKTLLKAGCSPGDFKHSNPLMTVLDPGSLEYTMSLRTRDGNLPSRYRILAERYSCALLLKQAEGGILPHLQFKSPETDLITAVKVGDIDSVGLLLLQGKTPNQTLEPGTFSPLMLAAERGDVPLIQLLLIAGANPNYQDVDMGLYALYLVLNSNISMLDKSRCARMILEAGGVSSLQTFHDKSTALHLAARQGMAETVHYMLRENVNRLIRDYAGRTPLDEAKESGDLPTIRVLQVR